MKKSILVKSQKQKHTIKNIIIDGERCDLIVNIRYDDQCNNGHNSFSITGDVYMASRRSDSAHIMGGCIHEVIAEHASQFKHLIKWHLMSSNEPLHYVANTLYHISDKDYNGLKKGEYSYFNKIVMGCITKNNPVEIFRTNTIYTNKEKNPNLEKSNIKQGKILNDFVDNLNCEYEIIIENCEHSKSEGKEINLDAARSCAIWPSAELSDLTKENLIARLPKLRLDFINMVEKLGMVY